MLVVAEDCCVNNTLHGRRGLSGIILLIKIAGAMAENGHNLEETLTFCQKVQSNMTSILLSLGAPSSNPCTCSKHHENVKIGSGFYGEPAVRIFEKSVTVSDICKTILEAMTLSNFELDISTPIIILINNLGNALQIEEFIFVKELLNYFQNLKIPILHVYQGHFMTALDRRGFTITILKVHDPKVTEYIAEQCETVTWGSENITTIPHNIPELVKSRTKERKPPAAPIGPSLRAECTNELIAALQFVCNALIVCEKQLNVMDLRDGTNNCGTNLKLGAQGILSEIKDQTLKLTHPCMFFDKLSCIVQKNMGGTAGAIYGILFKSASTAFEKYDNTHNIDDITWLECLKEASDTLANCLHLRNVHGTLYDPLRAFTQAISNAFNRGIRGMDAFKLGIEAAKYAIQQTKLPSMKYVDPGAHAVGIWMNVLYEWMKLREFNIEQKCTF